MPPGPSASSWKICGIAIPSGTRDFIRPPACAMKPQVAQKPRCAGWRTLPNESWLSWRYAALGNVEDQWYCVSDQKPTWERPGPRHGAIEPVEQSRDRDSPASAGDTSQGGQAMEQVIERCSGLDVHKKTVAACVRVPGPGGTRAQHVRTFGTTVAELLTLRDWLEAHGVTHVAMESTGVYWKPIFYVLEEAFACVLANAAHIAQVPGRKTDVKDCQWIAQLLEHGLIRGSFVPPAPIRELRDLTSPVLFRPCLVPSAAILPVASGMRH